MTYMQPLSNNSVRRVAIKQDNPNIYVQEWCAVM